MTEPTLSAEASSAAGWQRLPVRARLLCLLGPVLPLLVPGVFGGVALARALDLWVIPLVTVALAVMLGTWIGLKQYRYTYWKLDDEGLAIRRGRMWQRETRVPITRVQHLDLKRGPLQRMRGLATLIVHTAGTRHSAVTVPHLDADDAERLRDRLGRQIDPDDDA
ncbi:PH domain-containing protein [Lysobacter sp. LF1]|uniref:PH domain-containing protein n=1 Tax=Lysobacter stagni TaxID=3045172 RepID=A0ABT6XE11_9GAMM|nr:PH domain-containing protein [Lysobacter sp. LF1]MDI9238376.1 PH domain-containing protein [Lysobacter sp. LF1]